MNFETSASCAAQSQQFIKRTGLASPLLLQCLLGKTTQLRRIGSKLLLPGYFILHGFYNLRGNRILLLLRKRSHPSQHLQGVGS
jgi:hypothetical protein